MPRKTLIIDTYALDIPGQMILESGGYVRVLINAEDLAGMSRALTEFADGR